MSQGGSKATWRASGRRALHETVVGAKCQRIDRANRRVMVTGLALRFNSDAELEGVDAHAAGLALQG
jgi:hypothetical protein